MRRFRPFLWGRAVALLPFLYLGAMLTSYAFWYAGLEIDRCSVPLREVIGITYLLVGAWCIAPKMPSWELTGIPSVRPMAAVCALGVLASAVSSQLLLFRCLTLLPSAVVPRSDQYSLDGYDLDVWYPVMANMMVVGGVIFTSVAALGRPIGTLVSATVYGGLIYVSTMTSVPVPYASYCAERDEPSWVAGIVVCTLAIAVWLRTGGTTSISRRFDYQR